VIQIFLERRTIYQIGIKRADFGGIGYIWSEILGGNKLHENDPNFYLIVLVNVAQLFDYTTYEHVGPILADVSTTLYILVAMHDKNAC
jgi:hypothetical protein